jgi:hypothetical protein
MCDLTLYVYHGAVVRLAEFAPKLGPTDRPPQSFINNFTHSIICKSFFFLSRALTYTHIVCYYKIINITTAARTRTRGHLFSIRSTMALIQFGVVINFAPSILVQILFFARRLDSELSSQLFLRGGFAFALYYCFERRTRKIEA